MGNYIGTDKNGTAALGNSAHGVLIEQAPKNTVGGTIAEARNIISSNGQYGVHIALASATGNKVMGNYIGTDVTGTVDLGNSSDGVHIERAPSNAIGGKVTNTSNPRNVITGNDGSGVYIHDTGATGNRVVGNYIGTDASGTGLLGNANDGVSIEDVPSNTVGGNGAAKGNKIAGNGRVGVFVFLPGATGNRILSNSIYSNGQLGIDLSASTTPDGVTPNDADDPDPGPNNLQNFPVLTSATRSGSSTTIKGTLNSIANKTFTIQFFSSPTPDPSGNGEGKKFIVQKNVTTNGSGNVSFSFSGPAVTVGEVVTATAIKLDTSTGPAIPKDTSEFSGAVVVS